MTPNILEINHTKLGVEKFKIATPTYNLYKTEEGIWEFTIHFTSSETIQRVKELEDVIDPLPNVEATAILSENEITLRKGTIIHQEHGYDYDRDENLSVLYYFSHNSIENLSIELLEVEKESIIVTIKGDTIVDGYADSEPDAQIYIYNTKFLLNKDLQRSFS